MVGWEFYVFLFAKMPNNFVHIGLIKLILPKAKIIDARRNPMDACFSCSGLHLLSNSLIMGFASFSEDHVHPM